MRDANIPPLRLSRANLKDLYWTIAQMVAHHTSNGCNLRPGDLLATGTVSGPDKDSRGCLLELTRRGADPLTLPTGEIRKFLEDGDEITLRGYCERAGLPRIGLGEFDAGDALQHEVRGAIVVADGDTDEAKSGDGRRGLAGAAGFLHGDGKHTVGVKRIGEHLAITRFKNVKRQKRLREESGVRQGHHWNFTRQLHE